MKQNTLTQLHLLRVNLVFHQVNLIVKFPCEIVLLLRNQNNKLISQTTPRSLVQGTSDINQELEIEWESIYDVGKSQYTQSKMDITVQVHSSNGNIIAGQCSCDVARIIEKSVIPLNKCSDKSAKLSLSCSFQFLHIVGEKQLLNSSKSSANLSMSSPGQSLKRMRSVVLINTSSNEQGHTALSRTTNNNNSKLENYLRSQNEQLHRENDVLREKIRNFERKEKDLMQQLKETLIKYDKLNNKFVQYDNIQQVNQILLTEKDRTIKQLEYSLTKYGSGEKQRQDELKMLEKKQQIKGQSLQDQLKRANDKIVTLQNELQQMTLSQSGLLTKYEEIQKTNQQNIREKEKVYTVQKARLNTELKEKDREIKRLVFQNEKFIHRLDQYESSPHRKLENSEFERLIDQKDQEISALNLSLNKIKLAKDHAEEELQDIKKANEDKLSLRRKMNQLQSQNFQLKSLLQKNSQSVSTNELRSKELCTRVEELEKEKRKMQNKLDEISSSNSSKLSKYIEMQKEYIIIKDNHQQLQENYRYDKSRFEQSERRLSEQTNEWNKKIEQLMSEKRRLENQNNQNRWELQRYQQGIRQSQSTLHSLKKENFQLKQQLLIYTERADSLQILKKEQQSLQIKYKEDLDIRESRIKDMQKQIGQKQLKIQSQERKIAENQQQLRQQKKIIDELKEKLQDEKLQQEVKEESQKKLRNELNQKIDTLNKALAVRQQEHQSLVKQINALTQNISILSEQNNTISQQNIKISSEYGHKESDLKLIIIKLSDSQRQTSDLRSTLIIQKEGRKKDKEDYDAYKEKMSQAVRWVLCLLGRQEPILEQQTVLFPESNLCSLELQAIKNRNLFLNKMKQSYNSLKEQKEFIALELEKIGQELIQTQRDYQQILEKERQDQIMIEMEFNQQRQDFMNEIEDLKHAQLQMQIVQDKFFKEKKLLEHQLEQSERQHQSLSENKLELEIKIKQGERKIEQLSDTIQTLKRQNDYKTNQLSQAKQAYYMQERDRLQFEIVNLQKNTSKKDEQNISKDEKIKILEEKLIMIDSEKRKFEFDIHVTQQLLKESEARNENLIQIKSKKMERIQQLQHQLEEREKHMSHRQIQIYENASQRKELDSKLSQATQNYSNSLIKIEKLEKELNIKYDEIKDLKIRYKQNEESSSKEKQNMQEQMSRLVGQIDIYRLLLEKAEAKSQQLDRQSNAYYLELESKKELLLKIESDSEMMQKEIYFEQSHKNTLSRQYEQISLNYQHAKTEIYALEEEKLRLEKEISDLKHSVRVKEKEAEDAMENSRMRVIKEIEDLKRRIEQESNKNIRAEGRAEELKNKFKDFEAIIEKKEFQILRGQQERQKLRAQYEQELQRFAAIIEKQQEKSEELLNEHHFEKEQMIRQIEGLTHQCLELNNLIQSKEHEIEQVHRLHDDSTQKIIELQNQVKTIQNGKSNHAQNQKIDLLEGEIQNLKTIASNLDIKFEDVKGMCSIQQIEGQKIGDVLRQIGSGLLKLKLNLLSRIKGEQDRKAIISDYRQLQQKLDNALKSHKINTSA